MNDIVGYPDPGLDLSDGFKPHTSHWGVFSARHGEDGLEVRPYAADPDPSGIIDNFPGALRHQARIAQPMIRRGWLERGPGPDDRRGSDEFVPCRWEKALDLLAAELRASATSTARAVFGGSYGWASAGRFHHAQRQLHRFLNIAGGYVRSVNSYSSGRVARCSCRMSSASYEDLAKRNVTWEQIAEHSDIVLAFGGMALKNTMLAGGSDQQAYRARRHAPGAPARLRVRPRQPAARRPAGGSRRRMARRPPRHRCRADARHRPHPGQRGAARPRFPRPLLRRLAGLRALSARRDRRPAEGRRLGRRDLRHRRRRDRRAGARARRQARARSPSPIRCSAPSMASSRSGWAIVLAAMLGQIGLPGGGFAYALGAIAYYGRRVNAVPVPTCRRAATALRTSSRWRASPTCCCIPARPSTTTARR